MHVCVCVLIKRLFTLSNVRAKEMENVSERVTVYRGKIAANIFSVCITPTFHPRSEDLVELSLSRCERERGNKGKRVKQRQRSI